MSFSLTRDASLPWWVPHVVANVPHIDPQAYSARRPADAGECVVRQRHRYGELYGASASTPEWVRLRSDGTHLLLDGQVTGQEAFNAAAVAKVVVQSGGVSPRLSPSTG